MRIAFTADCHLDDRDRHPERYAALEDILKKLDEEGIRHLIIAGDLFDRQVRDYSRFEALCSRYHRIGIGVIPGNHDSHLGHGSLALSNVRVHDSVGVEEMGGLSFLFVPYRSGTSMGAAAAACGRMPRGDWVLVGHGDSSAASGVGNAYEEGTYMPLSSAEVEELRPSLILLGHIHARVDEGRLHYPGSPCGMDITETGPRRFLVLDSKTMEVTGRTVDTEVVFLQAEFLVVPEDNAEDRLRGEIEAVRSAWSAKVPDVGRRARIRVRVAGYTPDRRGIVQCVSRGFEDLDFYGDESPDFSGLRESADRDRSQLARLVRERIDGMQWDFGDEEPSRSQVIRRALEMIYG